MARPIRVEFSGALYHVTSRGDRREAIYEDDADRLAFLKVLGDTVRDFNWLVHAYCLMGNHYHLVVETPEGNLSKGMRQLNGVFTQMSNRRYRRGGHLFQGRYKAILVDRDSYLLELTRYVVLNPVRADMVRDAGDWQWSSYLAMVGAEPAPQWLATDGLLAQFATRRADAIRRYAKFVAAGVGAEPIWKHLNRQMFLGDDSFVARMQKRNAKAVGDINIPKTQRRKPAPDLPAIAAKHRSKEAAMVAAHATGQYSYQQIANHFGVHFTTVGRAVRASKAVK
jgi:REP element-mobilizing transposase RayT